MKEKLLSYLTSSEPPRAAEFRRFELDYWQLAMELDLFHYLIPSNLAESKNSFIESCKTGNPQDPTFTYPSFNFDSRKSITELRALEYQLHGHETPLIPLYRRMIQEDTECIEYLSNRTDLSFSDWLSGLYGYPTESEIEQAWQVINTTPLDSSRGSVSSGCFGADKMYEAIEESLYRLNIEGWKIVIENSSARIAVNPVQQLITLKDDAIFHSEEKERLIVHEIGVHVARSVNGSKQPYLIFMKGFPDYLMTEEGLAILGELKSDLLSNDSLLKYCCRLIVAGACKELGFAKCFAMISGVLPASDCFDICARAKRGLINTSSKGGFTKDLIYMRGLWSVQQLKRQQVADLFVGKVGIDDLPLLEEIEIDHSVKHPEWVELIK